MSKYAEISDLQLPYSSRDALESRLRESDLWGPMIIAALAQATASHGNTLRDSGQPYLEEHVYPITANVVTYLDARDKDPEVQLPFVVASILHDTVEDDPNFGMEECEKVFGRDVTSYVYYLTKFGAVQDIYIRKLESAVNNVKVIKLFDRINNLRCSIVLSATRPEKLERYLAETEKYYLPIADMLFDKKFHSGIENLINLGHLALNSTDKETAND